MRNPFDDLRRYADDLASEVSGADARRAVNRALASPARRPRRAIVAVVTTALLGVSNVALAATADPSIPGDALYGVDRAYERLAGVVGLGGVNASERVEEAGALIHRGNFAAALGLVRETLEAALESDDPTAAIDELEAAIGGPPVGVQALVDVARDIGRGDATGEEVAEAARNLVERIDRANPPASPAATAPGATNPNRGGNRP